MTNVTQTVGAAPHSEEWQGKRLAELIQYIVVRHHAYLRDELPGIEAALASQPQIEALVKVFRQFSRGMLNHMQKEEAILFPMIERLESARCAGKEPPLLPFGTIEHPIAVMEQEHGQARKELAEIRTFTHEFTQGEASTLERLRTLDTDMAIHSGLEDDILFPGAIGMEREPAQ